MTNSEDYGKRTDYKKIRNDRLRMVYDIFNEKEPVAKWFGDFILVEMNKFHMNEEFKEEHMPERGAGLGF
jgi:hypothetical protein